MTVSESGIDFRFQPGWAVVAYDRHTYFQGLSAAGLSGVDFLALHRRAGLWLIEVKNYRQVVPPPPEVLADQLWQKGADTLSGLRAIQTFLNRSRARRFWHPLWRLLPPGRSQRAFWLQATAALRSPLPYLVWIEGEQLTPAWREAFLIHMQRPENGRELALNPAFSGSNPYPALLQKVS